MNLKVWKKKKKKKNEDKGSEKWGFFELKEKW